MKLNLDCIRDILLIVEEFDDVDINEMNYKGYKFLCDYDYEELCYHLEQCYMYDFFVVYDMRLDFSFKIVGLKPKGHEYIANIRDKKNYTKLKKAAEQLGITSIATFGEYVAKSLLGI